MTYPAEPHEPSDEPGSPEETEQVEQWLSLPLFDMSDGEQLEELATYGAGPLRAAARAAQALAAHRAAPLDSAPEALWHQWLPRLRACVATLLVTALAAAIALGGWPRSHLRADTADALGPAAAPSTSLSASPPMVPATLTTLPLLHPPAAGTPSAATAPSLTAPPAPATAASKVSAARATTLTTAAPKAAATSKAASAVNTVSAPSLAPTPVTVVQPDAPLKDPLPVGKFEWVPAGTTPAQAAAVATDAAGAGLNDLVVPAASATGSFALLNALIPAAHRAGLRVVAAQSPSLSNPAASAAQAVSLASFSAAGQHLDGLMSELNGPLTAAAVGQFAATLRSGVGLAYPLVAAFPVAAATGTGAPTAATLADFDALAPIVTITSATLGAQAETVLSSLGSLGQPLLPVATGASMTEGALGQFLSAADRAGAVGVGVEPPPSGVVPSPAGAGLSASPASGPLSSLSGLIGGSARPAPALEVPTSLSASPLFDLQALNPLNALSLLPSQVRPFQAELASLGLPVAITGTLDEPTTAALATYQQASQLPPTGQLTPATGAQLLAPVAVLAP